MNVVKAIGGAVLSLAGTWVLGDIPIANPLPYIGLGWVFLLLGLAILAPALVDLLLGEDEA